MLVIYFPPLLFLPNPRIYDAYKVENKNRPLAGFRTLLFHFESIIPIHALAAGWGASTSWMTATIRSAPVGVHIATWL